MTQKVVRLRCGRDELEFPLLPRLKWDILTARQKSTANLLSTDTVLEELLQGLEETKTRWGARGRSARAVLVLPDETRPFPWSESLSPIVDSLDHHGIPRGNVCVLIATGSHRPDKDSLTRFQRGAPDGVTIRLHSADTFHRVMGESVAGTVVEIDPVYCEADLRITAGEVAFHYFAGFGGGPKMVFPGLASRAAIRTNHRRALAALPPGGLAPGCVPGVLYGNPVAEDIADCVSHAYPEIAVHVLRSDRGPLFALGESGFVRARTRLFECGAVGERGAYDVVVASVGGAPRDIDFVQSHKALRHASQYARPGGCILMVAETPAGLGSESVERWLEVAQLAELEERARIDYDLNAQTAISLRTLENRFRVAWYGTKIPDRLRGLGLDVRNEKTLLEACSAFVGGQSSSKNFQRGAVIPAATEVIPATVAAG